MSKFTAQRILTPLVQNNSGTLMLTPTIRPLAFHFQKMIKHWSWALVLSFGTWVSCTQGVMHTPCGILVLRSSKANFAWVPFWFCIGSAFTWFFLGHCWQQRLGKEHDSQAYCPIVWPNGRSHPHRWYWYQNPPTRWPTPCDVCAIPRLYSLSPLCPFFHGPVSPICVLINTCRFETTFPLVIHHIHPTSVKFSKLHNLVARTLLLTGSLNNITHILTGQSRAIIHLFQKAPQLCLASQWIMVALEMLVEWMVEVQVTEG